MAFDASIYESIPQMNVPGTLALTRGVITAGKGVQFPPAKKALKRVREAGEALRAVHHAVPPVKEENVKRAADALSDKIWGALEKRLSAWFELGGEDAAEAARVYAIVFPAGLTFLSLKYAEQWAEADAALARIESEKLDAPLERFVGAVFLREVRARHEAYGEALGITKARAPAPEGAVIIEPLRQLRAALATYTRVLVAATENGDFAEAQAMHALEPVVAMRASIRASKKRAGGSQEEEPAPPVSPEPLPPVDE